MRERITITSNYVQGLQFVLSEEKIAKKSGCLKFLAQSSAKKSNL